MFHSRLKIFRFQGRQSSERSRVIQADKRLSKEARELESPHLISLRIPHLQALFYNKRAGTVVTADMPRLLFAIEIFLLSPLALKSPEEIRYEHNIHAIDLSFFFNLI